jgi:hypothetical protein
MPTWYKARIHEIQTRTGSAGSYRGLGRQFAASTDFEGIHDGDLNDRFTDVEWKAMARWNGVEGRHYLRPGVDPNPILKRMFADERHPDGNGDLLRQIPPRKRAEYLCGILDGLVTL